eukprot:COSAG02_NODE_337_length_24268_cov_7.498738_7_plen_34_part_00
MAMQGEWVEVEKAELLSLGSAQTGVFCPLVESG